MASILDIATAVPEFTIEKEDIERFYSDVFKSTHSASFFQKISLLNEKTKINRRHSCIPDYNGSSYELYTDGDYRQPVEKRMEAYKNNILPFAEKAIDSLLQKNNIDTNKITHLITVSCTGLFAPGFEFLVSEKYGLQHAEKLAINFMGCYAGLKALKHANYIANSDPNACVLIICAEICSLHFYPSDADEDIISNLLFADGAAATLVCGKDNEYIQNKIVLSIDSVGSAYIPSTLDLMTWNISSSAFRMYLSKEIVTAIKENIEPVLSQFLKNSPQVDYWAIHPGGVKIVESVKDQLKLSEDNVADSMNILQNYGNMSSPTILFILDSIFTKIKKAETLTNKKIVSCAFGPGITVEMIQLSAIETKSAVSKTSFKNLASEV